MTGEAGIGKTRLVTTAAARTAPDTFVAVGHCLPLSTEVELLPSATSSGRCTPLTTGSGSGTP